MIRSKPIALTLMSFAAASAVVLAAGRAAAQDQGAIDKLVQMNKKALEDYDTLEWDAAKRTLLDALMAGKKAGLDAHPVMARTYVHLGAVYITGFKNRDKAIQSFVRAIEIDPSIQLSKGIATADVNDAFAEAQRKAKGGSGGGASSDSAPPPPTRRRRGPVMDDDSSSSGEAPPRSKRSRSSDDESAEPDLPVRIQALDCPEPEEAILDKSVTLRCALSPKLPVTSVYLMYRAPGKDDYTEVEMTKTPKGWFQGKIPKKAVVGKSLQYYYEGRSEAGKPVVANGGHDSPNIMLIVEAAEAGKSGGSEGGEGGGEPGGDEENPLDVDQGPKRPRRYLGRRNTEIEGLDLRYGKRKWWIGLGLGSGYGYAKGNGLEAVNKSPDPNFNGLKDLFVPGLAWAGVAHLEPEVGYQFNPDMAVSIAGRLQYIPQESQFAKYGARGALSALGKFYYYTKQSQLRFFGAGILGGGEGARFIVYPAAGGNSAVYKNFKDTIRGGPGLAGVGAGLYYEISKGVSFVLEVDALGAFPGVAFFADGNLGIQMNFY